MPSWSIDDENRNSRCDDAQRRELHASGMLRPALLASSAVQLLIKQYREPDDYCTGTANEAQLALARAKYHYSEPNDVRDVIDKKLQAYGWCFGERGQTNSQMKWHRCNANSCIGDA